MPQIARVRSVLTGFPGGPGVVTMYGHDGPSLADEIRTMWVNVSTLMPADVSIQVQATGDLLESTTGEINGVWVHAAIAAVQGSEAGIYAAPVGALFTWRTGVILSGRHLRGRTFIVPLAASQYATDGGLAAPAVGLLAGVASAYQIASVGNFLVWQRPRPARAATATKPALAARAGGHGDVTTSSVSAKVVVLRSRRD